MSKQINLALKGDFTNNVSIGKFDIVTVEFVIPATETEELQVETLTGKISNIHPRLTPANEIAGELILDCSVQYEAETYTIKIQNINKITLITKYTPPENAE